jgi:hypothetical protein
LRTLLGVDIILEIEDFLLLLVDHLAEREHLAIMGERSGGLGLLPCGGRSLQGFVELLVLLLELLHPRGVTLERL